VVIIKNIPRISEMVVAILAIPCLQGVLETYGSGNATEDWFINC
jgi:L-asparaginase/Glu-tRNA(Gln) amidotransferase subunit D